MNDITIKLDVRDAQAKLSAFAKNQLPYALSLAVNDLAFQAMRAENARMPTVFKNPKPFTRRATQVESKATKGDPTAVVSVRPGQAKYLAPYEVGGVHVLPGKALLNPKDINLDKYGQLQKGRIKRLLARPDVFVANIRGISGIWQRLTNLVDQKGNKVSPNVRTGSGRIKLLIRFGTALPVNKSLGWNAAAEALLTSQWPATFNRAMTKAISTAKL
jgi:hypothetical protein